MTSEQLPDCSAIIDLNDLTNRCLGNLDFVLRILKLLSDRGEEDIVLLEEAADRRDLDQVYHVSHRLKGAFANASAAPLSCMAHELCTAAAAGDADASLATTRTLRARWNEFSSVLQQLESAQDTQGAMAIGQPGPL